MGYQVTNQYGAILVNDESTLNEPKEIRFITPEYREKFKLPDGGHVLIGRRNGSVTEHKCKFLDPYHFLLDHTTYHICQFAEMLQASGSYVVPFPEKRVIWSNIDMDMETWKQDLMEDYPDLSDEEYATLAEDMNDGYLGDERANLDVTVGDEILVIGDIGLWDGRRMGYKYVEGGNISDCLYGSPDGYYCEWFVDRDGAFRSTQIHHDGKNYKYYRKWKDGVSFDERDELIGKLYNG